MCLSIRTTQTGVNVGHKMPCDVRAFKKDSPILKQKHIS